MQGKKNWGAGFFEAFPSGVFWARKEPKRPKRGRGGKKNHLKTKNGGVQGDRKRGHPQLTRAGLEAKKRRKEGGDATRGTVDTKEKNHCNNPASTAVWKNTRKKKPF